MANSDYGIKTSGDDLNWRNLNNDHEDNPVVSALVKDADRIFSNENNDHEIKLNEELISDFSKYLLANKLGSYFEDLSIKQEVEKTDKKNKKKDKKITLSKKEQLKANIEKEKNKKEIQKFLSNLKVNEETNFYPLKKNKIHESFLSIVYWACFLIKNYKNEKINTEILCDGAISLFRAIRDCDYIINQKIKDICFKILDKLQSCLMKKNKNHVYDLLSKYYYLITTSLWDKDKPNNIVLYNEQKDAIIKIHNSIVEDKPLFLFYWVPPANGKTLVSVIIAKIISNYFKNLIRNKLDFHKAEIHDRHEIENYDDDFCTKKSYDYDLIFENGVIQYNTKNIMVRSLESNTLKNKNIVFNVGDQVNAQKYINKKVMLYICYNDIVRNNVSSLCVTHNVDIKFWIATYRQDKYKPHISFVDLRPYKNCYPDWRKKKSPRLFKIDESKSEERYSTDLRVQILQYLDETRMLDIREKEYEDRNFKFGEKYNIERCSNLPEMIITDLDSAYELLLEFPDLFVPYFDEAFAASNQMITSKIMSVLPKTSVLVSATLAEQDKIPTILNNFKERHNADDTSIQTIKSNTQHINCEFISPDGNLISPFHLLNNANEIDNFLQLMEKNPIIQRGFSNLIVLEMFQRLKDFLPTDDNLLFIDYLGNITNSNVREYGIKLLKFCSDKDEMFNIIKKVSIPRIQDNNIENIFTKNAYMYNDKNTLHVSNPDNFDNYVNSITTDLLKDSPNLKKLISEFKKSRETFEKQIEYIKEKVKDDDDGSKSHRLNEAEKALSEIKFKYPNEFIMNSLKHLRRFNSKTILSNYQSIMFNSEIVNNFSDIMSKLYLSGIGVYNQTTLSQYELQIFLKYKDLFRFIISDPSIIYGTNINLTMIDIHENMGPISTRNTMYQLMGRGGRFGKSSSAIVNFRSWDLFQIVVDDNDINQEATNIENNLITFLN